MRSAVIRQTWKIERQRERKNEEKDRKNICLVKIQERKFRFVSVNGWSPWFHSFLFGLLTTRITESPRKNNLFKYLSLLIDFFDLVRSDQNSVTSSRTMLQCRSNDFTRPKSFLLCRQLIMIWVLLMHASFKRLSGPTSNSLSLSAIFLCTYHQYARLVNHWTISVSNWCLKRLEDQIGTEIVDKNWKGGIGE